MTRFSPTSGTTSASVPIAAILTNAGSHLLRPARPQSACTSFSATPTPARYLSGYEQSWRFGIQHGHRHRQLVVRLVVVGDDQVDAELARPPRRFDAADAAVDGNDQRDAVGVQPLDGRRLQAVAVAQPLGNEMDDVAAEHLERATEDDGRRDAVDVVVAVNGDPLAAGDGLLEPLDRRRHAGQLERIVQVIQRRVKEPPGEVRDRQSRAGTAAARPSDAGRAPPRAQTPAPSSHGRCSQTSVFMRRDPGAGPTLSRFRLAPCR